LINEGIREDFILCRHSWQDGVSHTFVDHRFDNGDIIDLDLGNKTNPVL
jgi:hypothetical protein